MLEIVKKFHKHSTTKPTFPQFSVTSFQAELIFEVEYYMLFL